MNEASLAMAEAAHAKINLTLHVTGRRPDGYHLLDSLAVFAPAADRLWLEPSEEGAGPAIALRLTGRFGAGLSAGADNLVLRAAHALAPFAVDRRPAMLVLEKNLPVASGIGGGSADAAAALRLLHRFWQVEMPLHGEEMMTLAAGLGADVPVCLAQRAARMQGVGEVLLPAPVLPPVAMVLVNCGLPVSTPEVFRARAPAFRPPAAFPPAWADAAAMAADLRRAANDLEPPALSLCPPIGAVLTAIDATRDCLLARMSGSGATCFGLYETADQAAAAAAALRRPGWWVAHGAVDRSAHERVYDARPAAGSCEAAPQDR